MRASKKQLLEVFKESCSTIISNFDKEKKVFKSYFDKYFKVFVLLFKSIVLGLKYLKKHHLNFMLELFEFNSRNILICKVGGVYLKFR